jgi:GTP-binding protein Era
MTKDARAATRAGYVALLGAPNAGKSTLLNRLVGQKISITSPKPQTTRMRVTGIWNSHDKNDPVQIIFVDTPGIFEPKRRLDRAMVQAAWQAIEDADVLLLLIDADTRRGAKIDAIIGELRRRKKRITLALNKIDKVARAKLLPLAAELSDTGIVEDVFMISALSGDGVEDLRRHLAGKMPEGPWFFGEDQLSDLPSQLLVAEITREQLYRQLQQELPYAATVVPESWENKKDGSAVIRQTILVARKAHRPIVLGKGGARIKSIGAAARKDIAKFLGCPAHLFLEVKCDETWQERPELYRLFGLEFKASAGK